MKTADAKQLLEELRAIAAEGDSEAAHSLEDHIRGAVLEAIADGSAEDARALARVALSTADIEFERWMA